jgi:hypothetical protein
MHTGTSPVQNRPKHLPVEVVLYQHAWMQAKQPPSTRVCAHDGAAGAQLHHSRQQVGAPELQHHCSAVVPATATLTTSATVLVIARSDCHCHHRRLDPAGTVSAALAQDAAHAPALGLCSSPCGGVCLGFLNLAGANTPAGARVRVAAHEQRREGLPQIFACTKVK